MDEATGPTVIAMQLRSPEEAKKITVEMAEMTEIPMYQSQSGEWVLVGHAPIHHRADGSIWVSAPVDSSVGQLLVSNYWTNR